MSRNCYWEIYLQIVWHTKGNFPFLVDAIEDRVHRFLKNRICRTPGAYVYETGGSEDHLHLAVSVPPTLLLSDWIGKLKGSSTHYLNQQFSGRGRMSWQDGYGVVSFGRKDLPFVCEYIRRQKEHHARGTTIARLEAVEGERLKPVSRKPLEAAFDDSLDALSTRRNDGGP
ncbi:MAG TPA: IS200/IS605 family transposase [Acidobacteriota bacterium]|nr:IS200/IS605 family transposase [Acidobacteriota bacterium]